MKFKITFPAGTKLSHITDDNIDVNIILENGEVYFATVYTTTNIDSLMRKNNEKWFWATDMVIVRDLNKETIRESLGEIIKLGYYREAFTLINTLENLFPGKSFKEIPDMADGYTINN